MDFMVIILAIVVVYVARPAFTGKGKLMALENVKEGKEKIAKKGLQICYLIMFFCALIMLLVNLLQSRGFTVDKYSVTFEDAFTAADGTVYEKDQNLVMTIEELQALFTAPATEETQSSGTAAYSCMGTANNYVSVPCKYEAIYETTKLGEKVPGADAYAKFKLVRTVSVIFFFISLADIVFLVVFTNKMTDKAKKEKAREAAEGRRVPGMPSQAFNFDADEPTAPDDPKIMELMEDK